MCLVDEVLDWDEARLVCRSANHVSADHPLRAGGRLGAICGIEYAAQAMALHGAVLCGADRQGARGGFLASVRSVVLHVARLDDIGADLRCEVLRIAADATGLVYEFRILAGSLAGPGLELVTGRATIVIDTAASGAIDAAASSAASRRSA